MRCRKCNGTKFYLSIAEYWDAELDQENDQLVAYERTEQRTDNIECADCGTTHDLRDFENGWDYGEGDE